MPETEMSLNDTIDTLRLTIARGRWWILLTGLVVTVATVVVAYLLPNLYSSEATLEIVQPQVSTRFVEPTSNTNPKDAVEAMTRAILSRSRLLTVINELGLYPKERREMSPEDLADLMRNAVTVQPVDQIPGRVEFSAFKISYKAETPRLAQAVTSRLTAVFVEENRKTQENQASVTTGFLQEQLDAARKRLEEQGDRQRAFQLQYLGELPDQQQANLGLLTNLDTQLQRNLTESTRLQQEAAVLESSLKESLDRMQADRASLLSRFTPSHPDVAKKEQEIARAQALLDRVTQKATGPSQVDLGGTPDPAVNATLNRVDANQRERERLSQEEKRLRTEIAGYEKRLNLAPIRAEQLSGILRDRELYLQEAQDLQTKLIQAQQSNSVETHEVGRKFRIVDTPTLPELPASPNRIKISLGGAAGGFLLGLALALLQRVRNTCFQDEKSLSKHFGIPFVVGVPLLLTSKEERLHQVKLVFEWAGATVVTFAVLAAEFFVYRHP